MQEVLPPEPVTYAGRFAEQVKAIRAMRSVASANIRGKYLYVTTARRKLRHVLGLRGGNNKYLSQIVIRTNLQRFSEKVEGSWYAPVGMRYLLPFVQEHPVLRGKRYLAIGTLEYSAPCLGEEYYRDFRKAVQDTGLKSGIEIIMQSLQTIYR